MKAFEHALMISPAGRRSRTNTEADTEANTEANTATNPVTKTAH